jgi:hypothetical protein
MYTIVPGCHPARKLPASVEDRFNCEALLTWPGLSASLFLFAALQFIVLVFPTCDTLMHTCPPMDVVEDIAQVGGHWAGGGDGVGSGLDFDGAVAAGGRTDGGPSKPGTPEPVQDARR